jgi:hypothetical protein
MARVWKQESEQIKEVIRESYRSDATFRRKAIVKVRGSQQIIPIEFAILLIHSAMWKVRDQYSFELFIKHYQLGIGLEDLVIGYTGHRKAQAEAIGNRIDRMLDTVIAQMPQSRANFMLNIYDDFIKIDSKDPPRPTSSPICHEGCLTRHE